MNEGNELLHVCELGRPSVRTIIMNLLSTDLALPQCERIGVLARTGQPAKILN